MSEMGWPGGKRPLAQRFRCLARENNDGHIHTKRAEEYEILAALFPAADGN
jgi:hypothetical protein